MVDGGKVGRARDGRVLQQRLGLGAERHPARHTREIERLDAEPVAGEHQPAAARVPQGDGEHAVEVGQEIEPAVLVEMDDDLGVGMIGGEAVAGALELLAQLDVIVDLAVEDDGDRLVLVEDRLLAGGDIDDGEPPRPERNARPLPEAGRVGPAMPQALRHPFEGRSVVGPGEASDAAHPGLCATKESSISSSAVGGGGAMSLGPASAVEGMAS